MCHPKRRKRRMKRRGKRRKNTKRRAGGIQTAVGPTLKLFTPVTSKGKKRQMGMGTHAHITQAHALLFIHNSGGLLLLCIYGGCVWGCVCIHVGPELLR